MNFGKKPERFLIATYGVRTLEIRIAIYLWSSFETFWVLQDLAKEPLRKCWKSQTLKVLLQNLDHSWQEWCDFQVKYPSNQTFMVFFFGYQTVSRVIFSTSHAGWCFGTLPGHYIS